MVAVVSDAGPLIHLAQIGKLALLEKLFGTVLVTEKVKIEAFDEGIKLGCADAGAVGEALADGWLKIEPFPERLAEPAVKLAEGENISKADSQMLLLAVEKKAELLVDEKLLSDLDKMYGLRVWSTWTLLLEILSRDYVGLSEVERAVNELGKKKVRLNAKQKQEILESAKFIEKRKRGNHQSNMTKT